MKKIIKTTVLTLSLLVILNTGAKIISAKTINNQYQNSVGIETQIVSINSDIDPDSKK